MLIIQQEIVLPNAQYHLTCTGSYQLRNVYMTVQLHNKHTLRMKQEHVWRHAQPSLMQITLPRDVLQFAPVHNYTMEILRLIHVWLVAHHILIYMLIILPKLVCIYVPVIHMELQWIGYAKIRWIVLLFILPMTSLRPVSLIAPTLNKHTLIMVLRSAKKYVLALCLLTIQINCMLDMSDEFLFFLPRKGQIILVFRF